MDYSNKLAVIVNASVDVLKLIREVLEQSRIKTVFFFAPEVEADSRGFVAFVNEHKPDLILFDVPIPYEDNLRLMARVRDSLSEPQPFLIMTTSPNAVQTLIDREPALAEGVIDIVVGKPFNLDELLEAVQRGFGKEAEEVGMSGDGRQAAGGSA